jgi:hypothetical protein
MGDICKEMANTPLARKKKYLQNKSNCFFTFTVYLEFLEF